jgi:hypothetical protein
MWAPSEADDRAIGARPQELVLRAKGSGLFQRRSFELVTPGHVSDSPICSLVTEEMKWKQSLGYSSTVRIGQIMRKAEKALRSAIGAILGKARTGLEEFTEPAEVLHDREILAWSSSVAGTIRIAEAALRTRIRLAGEVRAVTVRTDTPWPDFEAMLFDGTGEVRLRWLGVESIPGVIPGTRMVVEGMLGEEDGQPLIIDPSYELLFTPERP